MPKSYGVKLLSCEVDARVGAGYRLTFDNGGAQPMAFFGRYLEVTAPTRLVWTNEEGDGGTVVTTATFEEDHGRTRLVVHDLYPSKEALDEVVASGATNWDPRPVTSPTGVTAAFAPGFATGSAHLESTACAR